MPSLAPRRRGPGQVKQLTMPEVILEVVGQRKLLRVLGLDLVDQLGEEPGARAGRLVLLPIRSRREVSIRRRLRTALDGKTHSSCTTSFAEPALVFGHFFEFERRFEAGKVERAQASPLAAQELALAATRVAIVVIGLYVRSSHQLSRRTHNRAFWGSKHGMGTNVRAGNRRWQRPGQPRAVPTACPSLPGCRVKAWSAPWAIERTGRGAKGSPLSLLT